MKLADLTVFAAVLLSSTAAISQDDTNNLGGEMPQKKYKISDVSVFLGTKMQSIPTQPNAANFSKLGSGSQILGSDFQSFEGQEKSIFPEQELSANSYPLFGANVAFNLFGKDLTLKPKALWQLRAGLAYSSYSLQNIFLKVVTTPYDTTVSGGQTTFHDTVRTTGYDISYKTSQLFLDAALLLRVNPAGIVSIYTGIGVFAGTSLSSRTDIAANKSYSTVSTNTSTNEVTYTEGSSSQSSEQFKNKSTQQYSAYIPFGVDLKLGKHGFFNRIHIYAEGRPFASVTSIPELGTSKAGGLKILFGIRYTL